MSLQERTLVVRNFDPERTTDKLLKELCLQGGPVRKVVLRSDHAFVEFDDVDSVGYTMALLDGVKMFDRTLAFGPKLRLKKYSKYTTALNEYIAYDKYNRSMERQRRMQEQQQMQMQMQYQQQMQFQPQQLYPQQAHPAQMQYQHPSSMSPQRCPRPPPPQNFQGPQFRNYR